MTARGVLAGPPMTGAAPAKLSSTYISLAEQNCVMVNGPKPGDDFQDWSLSRCGKPVGGWKVYVDYGDVRAEPSEFHLADRQTNSAPSMRFVNQRCHSPNLREFQQSAKSCRTFRL